MPRLLFSIEKDLNNTNNHDNASVGSSLTSSNSYPELRIDGPPLYNQNCYHLCEQECSGELGSAHSPTVIPLSSSSSSSCSHHSPIQDIHNNATPAAPLPSRMVPSLVFGSLPLIASKTALLVVDVQPQYWSLCPAVQRDFPDFPDRMQQLIRTCRERQAYIIWVYADYRFDTSPWLKQFHRLHQGRIPPEVHFDKNSIGYWEDFAKPNVPHEPVITKTSWSCTSQTQLLDLLKQSGVDTVLVCGLITSVCVQHSAFGVFEAGYRTVLVTDACADRGRERHKAALALYGDYMYELKTVQDVQDEFTTTRTISNHHSVQFEPGEVSSSSSSTLMTSELTIDDANDDDDKDDVPVLPVAGAETHQREPMKAILV